MEKELDSITVSKFKATCLSCIVEKRNERKNLRVEECE